MSAVAAVAWRRGVLASVLLALLAGCATVQQPDPLEALNRKTFAFNESLDRSVVQPVARAYQAALPAPVRAAARNFFANVGDAWSGLNLLLQGRVRDGLGDVVRFGVNSTVGVLGLADVATGLGLERNSSDLGQTLGAWGLSSGAYIVWPFLGPSTLRDSAGLPIELLMGPELFVHDVAARNALALTHHIDTRANYLGAGQLLDQMALDDKYLFERDAYLAHRRSLVCGCDAPSPDADTDAGAAVPVAPAASAAPSAASAPAR